MSGIRNKFIAISTTVRRTRTCEEVSIKFSTGYCDNTISGNIISNYLSTYMYDSMNSAPDDKTAIDLYNILSTLWKNAHARKWLSNSEELLWEIYQQRRVDLDNGEAVLC